MKHLLLIIVLLLTVCFNSKAQQLSLMFNAGTLTEFSEYKDVNTYNGNNVRGLAGNSCGLSLKNMINDILGIRLGTNFQKLYTGIKFPYQGNYSVHGQLSSFERIQIPFELIWLKSSKKGKFTVEIGLGISAGFILNKSRFEKDWSSTDAIIFDLADSYGLAYDQKIESNREISTLILGKILIQYNLNSKWGISISGNIGKGLWDYSTREIRYAYSSQNMHYAKESFNGDFLSFSVGISYTINKKQNNSMD